MIAIAKLIAISLALIDVRVSLLDGRVIDASLKNLGVENLVVTDAGGEENTISLTDVVDLKFGQSKKTAESPSIDVLSTVLHDGSQLPVAQIELEAGNVNAKSDLLGDLALSRSAVRALRLQELQPDWQPQWNAYLERSNDKDLLIVVKRDGTGLDFLAGVVSSVNDESVPFLLDGDEIPVPRPRVFGVVFAADAESDGTSSSAVSLQLVNGSELKAGSVEMKDAGFVFESSWGQQLVIDASRLSGIDFSSGRLHYLSDLEPLSEKYFGMDPPGKEWGDLFAEDSATRTGLSSQWRMSRDRFPNNGHPPLKLRGKAFRKGICVFPNAEIEYALDGRYSRLTAVIGVDDDVAFNQRKGQPSTAVELRIEADGKEVGKHLVKATAEPFPLDLDVAGVNTLKVIVDFGDGESTCDYLDLADARLIIDTSVN